MNMNHRNIHFEASQYKGIYYYEYKGYRIPIDNYSLFIRFDSKSNTPVEVPCLDVGQLKKDYFPNLQLYPYFYRKKTFWKNQKTIPLNGRNFFRFESYYYLPKSDSKMLDLFFSSNEQYFLSEQQLDQKNVLRISRSDIINQRTREDHLSKKNLDFTVAKHYYSNNDIYSKHDYEEKYNHVDRFHERYIQRNNERDRVPNPLFIFRNIPSGAIKFYNNMSIVTPNQIKIRSREYFSGFTPSYIRSVGIPYPAMDFLRGFLIHSPEGKKVCHEAYTENCVRRTCVELGNYSVSLEVGGLRSLGFRTAYDHFTPINQLVTGGHPNSGSLLVNSGSDLFLAADVIGAHTYQFLDKWKAISEKSRLPVRVQVCINDPDKLYDLLGSKFFPNSDKMIILRFIDLTAPDYSHGFQAGTYDSFRVFLRERGVECLQVDKPESINYCYNGLLSTASEECIVYLGENKANDPKMEVIREYFRKANGQEKVTVGEGEKELELMFHNDFKMDRELVVPPTEDEWIQHFKKIKRMKMFILQESFRRSHDDDEEICELGDVMLRNFNVPTALHDDEWEKIEKFFEKMAYEGTIPDLSKNLEICDDSISEERILELFGIQDEDLKKIYIFACSYIQRDYFSKRDIISLNNNCTEELLFYFYVMNQHPIFRTWRRIFSMKLFIRSSCVLFPKFMHFFEGFVTGRLRKAFPHPWMIRYFVFIGLNLGRLLPPELQKHLQHFDINRRKIVLITHKHLRVPDSKLIIRKVNFTNSKIVMIIIMWIFEKVYFGFSRRKTDEFKMTLNTEDVEEPYSEEIEEEEEDVVLENTEENNEKKKLVYISTKVYKEQRNQLIVARKAVMFLLSDYDKLSQSCFGKLNKTIQLSQEVLLTHGAKTQHYPPSFFDFVEQFRRNRRVLKHLAEDVPETLHKEDKKNNAEHTSGSGLSMNVEQINFAHYRKRIKFLSPEKFEQMYKFGELYRRNILLSNEFDVFNDYQKSMSRDLWYDLKICLFEVGKIGMNKTRAEVHIFYRDFFSVNDISYPMPIDFDFCELSSLVMDYMDDIYSNLCDDTEDDEDEEEDGESESDGENTVDLDEINRSLVTVTKPDYSDNFVTLLFRVLKRKSMFYPAISSKEKKALRLDIGRSRVLSSKTVKKRLTKTSKKLSIPFFQKISRLSGKKLFVETEKGKKCREDFYQKNVDVRKKVIIVLFWLKMPTDIRCQRLGDFRRRNNVTHSFFGGLKEGGRIISIETEKHPILTYWVGLNWRSIFMEKEQEFGNL